MNIIKLNAIDSTNSYLKEIVRVNDIDNFTTVTAVTQTNGRGQMGSKWESQSNKNLTFSIFIKDLLKKPESIFDLNCIISVSIAQVLQNQSLHKLNIKWPNDILADSKKIAGILIENTFKSATDIQSIIGIGLNVNQNCFEGLEKATSIYNELGFKVDQELLLDEILEKIVNNIDIYKNQGADLFWNIYHNYLFMKDCNSTFIDNKTNSTFKGCILGVTKQGLLQVQTAEEERFFGIKEVTLLY